MGLDEYLRGQEKKFPGQSAERALARKISRSWPTINRIRNGLQTPSPETAKAIVKASGDEITLDDLFSPKPRKKRTNGRG
jgi:DNA-binding transcriptional regulator YdaS (Cro superfamily)